MYDSSISVSVSFRNVGYILEYDFAAGVYDNISIIWNMVCCKYLEIYVSNVGWRATLNNA